MSRLQDDDDDDDDDDGGGGDYNDDDDDEPHAMSRLPDNHDDIRFVSHHIYHLHHQYYSNRAHDHDHGHHDHANDDDDEDKVLDVSGHSPPLVLRSHSRHAILLTSHRDCDDDDDHNHRHDRDDLDDDDEDWNENL